jgi:hypothetical protein
MTREEILSLDVGTLLRHTLDTAHGKALLGARYGAPRAITRIFAQGISDSNKAYVCFYTEFGPNSEISGSITEGSESYVVVTP